jgi:CBS domain-containing protein
MRNKNVSEIMTAKLRTVRPEATIEEAAQIMADEDIGWLPVVDHHDQLLGALTDRDIAIRAVARGRDKDTRVDEVMSSGVVAARENQPIAEVAQLMQANQVRRIAIVDEDNKPLGVISLGDVAQRTREEHMVFTTMEQVATHT